MSQEIGTKPEIRLGVDLGGTKIEAIALARDGQIRFRARTPTPAGDYAATVRAIRDLVAQAADGDAAAPVGVGIPGTLSPATGLVKNANSTCLIGKALDRDLTEATGRRIRLANDADCFTLSEAADGAGADGAIVFGIILGTGVGGGLVVDKQVVRGPNAITGEWGHIPLPGMTPEEWPGPDCYCGRNGCVETFLCGPALSRSYARAAGEAVSAEEIAARAAAGEDAAAAVLTRYAERLARGTAALINIIDPHVMVLGGGLSNIAALYEMVPDYWRRHVFSDAVATRFVPALHGDSSGVRGAAWLWP